jgi:ribosomal protein L31E
MPADKQDKQEQYNVKENVVPLHPLTLLTMASLAKVPPTAADRKTQAVLVVVVYVQQVLQAKTVVLQASVNSKYHLASLQKVKQLP